MQFPTKQAKEFKQGDILAFIKPLPCYYIVDSVEFYSAGLIRFICDEGETSMSFNLTDELFYIVLEGDSGNNQTI